MEDNRMVSFSLGGMAFEYDDNKNQINVRCFICSGEIAIFCPPFFYVAFSVIWRCWECKRFFRGASKFKSFAYPCKAYIILFAPLRTSFCNAINRPAFHSPNDVFFCIYKSGGFAGSIFIKPLFDSIKSLYFFTKFPSQLPIFILYFCFVFFIFWNMPKLI